MPMLKRALFFSTPFCLSLKDNQMVINTKQMPEVKRTVPIEDIGYVVLEHQQTSITLPLLNALSDNNVAVIFCGDNCMPNAMLMNLDKITVIPDTLIVCGLYFRYPVVACSIASSCETLLEPCSN